MATDNLSVVLHKAGDIRLEQRSIPKFNDDQVLLRIDCVGICESDVDFLEKGHVNEWNLASPMILGHETSALVYKIGENVKNLGIGDRVAIETGVPCNDCRYCNKSRFHLCPAKQFCGLNKDGTMTRYFVHSPNYCHKLPDHVSMEEGALLGSLSVSVHACRKADICLGSIVAINGATPIGLMSLMVAKNMGAEKVIVMDYLENRLDLARELGADVTLQIQKDESEETIVKNVQRSLSARPDRTIDCTGNSASDLLSTLVTRSNGIVLIVGEHKIDESILEEAQSREIDIRTICRYDAYDYPIALHMVASRKMNIQKLITHHFDISETVKAFKTYRKAHKNGAVKIMIHIQPKDSNNFN